MRFSERNIPANLSFSTEDKCLIVYIDRFNTGQYKYIPIRYGRILSSNQEMNRGSKRLFLSISLDEYCNTKIGIDLLRTVQMFNSNCPQLTDGNPENINDGHYIIHVKDDILNYIESTTNSWSISVEEISTTTTFASKPFVYFRSEVLNEEGFVTTKCKSGKTYKLSITYDNPNNLVTEIETNFFLPLVRPGITKFKTGCWMDKIIVPFMVDKVYQSDSWTTISLKESSTVNPINFDIELEPIYLNKGNIVLIALLALFIFAPFFLSVIDIIPRAHWDNDLLKSVFDFSKWGVGLWLLIRLGKPVS